MKHEVNPEAVRALGYKVADLYADLIAKANCLPEEDKAALFRIMESIWAPFLESIEELGELGEQLVVEVSDD